MEKVIIKKNAAVRTVTFRHNGTKQMWDLSPMASHELDGVTELVVNWWCGQNGFPPLYINPPGRV